MCLQGELLAKSVSEYVTDTEPRRDPFKICVNPCGSYSLKGGSLEKNTLQEEYFAKYVSFHVTAMPPRGYLLIFLFQPMWQLQSPE